MGEIPPSWEWPPVIDSSRPSWGAVHRPIEWRALRDARHRLDGTQIVMPPQYDGTPPVRHRTRKKRASKPTPDYHSSQHAAQTRAYHPSTPDYHSSQHHAQTQHYHPPASKHYTKPLGSSVRKAMRAAKVAAKHSGGHHRAAGRRHRPGKGWTRSLSTSLGTGLSDAAGTAAFPGYAKYYGRLFDRAGKYYPGLLYSSPMLSYKEPSSSPSEAARGVEWVVPKPGGSEPVHVSPGAAADLFSKKPYLRNFARTTPLHEWTHVVQKQGLSLGESEGGAEAFALAVADGIGMKYRVSPNYYKYYQRALRRGRPWYINGQFFQKGHP